MVELLTGTSGALRCCRPGKVYSAVPKQAHPLPSSVPGVSFISGRTARRQLRASGGSHPAVTWQSHLLDVSPQQWTSLKVGLRTHRPAGAGPSQYEVPVAPAKFGA